MSDRVVVWRFDLDYAPWDTPDAERWGHGEPAMVLRLLDVARRYGLKFHFFASNRVLRAFPSLGETVLNEGHDLDWLLKHPERVNESRDLFNDLGHIAQGFATRVSLQSAVEAMRFGTGAGAPAPGVHWFTPAIPELREHVESGGSVRRWGELAKDLLSSDASEVILPIRPQVLAKVDPRLEMISPLLRSDRTPATLRDRVNAADRPA